MARQLRLEFDGALYHVTARGNARDEIYLNDTYRKTILDLLGRETFLEQMCYVPPICTQF